MITFFRLVRIYMRLGLLKEMEYRANFFVQLFQSLLRLGASLAGLSVVLSHTRTLAGWKPAELLAVLGVFFLVGGVIQVVIQPSMQQFMEDVKKGTLDFTLTKPADSQLLVSIREFQVWKLIDVLLGLGVLVLALVRLKTEIGVIQALEFGVALLAGGAIVYSFWLILATLCFWFIRVENILVIFQTMYQAARWPVGIYPGWLRISLTFIVPVAFAITVPVEALVGRLTWQTLAGATALAFFLLAASRCFWSIGVRHYSGASA